MEINAAVARANGGPLAIERVELDDPAPDEVLVRVVATGLCHTDITVLDYMPLPWPAVLGHEGAGIVSRVGAGVTKVKAGDHVLMTSASCGTCISCQQGEPSFCANFLAVNLSGGHRANGTCTHKQAGAPVFARFLGQSSFAEYVLASERSVFKVSTDLPLELLCPLGCGVQTGAGTVLNTLAVRAGSSIAVFGVGAVGLSAIMAAKIAGCAAIVAVDAKPDRLLLAKTLGATLTLNALNVDAVTEIQKLGGVDYAVEATGVPAVMEQAIAALGHRGSVALVGVAMGAKISLDPSVLQAKGLTIKGSLMAGAHAVPEQFLSKLIDFWRAGKLPIEKLVHYYDFADINTAIKDAHAGRVIKPVIRMPEMAIGSNSTAGK